MKASLILSQSIKRLLLLRAVLKTITRFVYKASLHVTRIYADQEYVGVKVKLLSFIS